MTIFLTRADVESVLTMKDSIEAVEVAFREMGEGKIEMPARVYLHFDEYKGFLTIMPASLRGRGIAGFKVATYHPDNPKDYDLPAIRALIVLNDPKNGTPLALMDGTYITAMRTGAAGAVGAKYLSRKDSKVAGIIGLGIQGRVQLAGLHEVRKIERVKVYDVIPAACTKFAKEMHEKLGVEIEVTESVEKAAKGVDILVTCTPSTQPYIKGEWISKRMHITVIGSDSAAKRELESNVFKRVDKLVVDFIEQAIKVGELSVPLSEGVLKRESIYAEMGEIVAGKKIGRETDAETTIFKATGLGIQDVSTAYKVYQVAIKNGIGAEITI